MHPQMRIDSKVEFTVDSLIQLIAQAPLNFPPGTDFAYSNTGYKVLSILLERALATPFPDIMRSLVFEPLGMKSTILWNPNAVVPHLAYGYMVSNGQLARGRYASMSAGHFGGDFFLLSTASDMARFAAELIHPRYVATALLTQMTSRAVLLDGTSVAYGFGIQPADARGVPKLEHGGTWSGGYTAFDAILPTRDLAVVVLTNNWDAQPWTLGRAITYLVDDSLRAIPAAMRDPNPERTKRIVALIKGDSTAMPMSPAFARHQYPVIVKLGGPMATDAHAFSFHGCDDVRRAMPWLPPLARSECYYQLEMPDGARIGLAVYFTDSGAITELRPIF
jgi:CubicO group peptidase (beta-lactamase class C family)